MARAAPLGLCRVGILPPDIERRAADGPVAQRGIDRILVDHLAACDVDEERGRLHQRKAAGVDQPGGLGPERGAQRHGVAFGQHPVEFGQREDSFDNGLGGTRAAVRGQNANAKRRRAPRHLTPDTAIADNAERRAAHLAMRRAALDPAGAPGGALAELAGNLDEPVMEGEPHHHDVFGDCRFVPKGVADRDPALQRGEVEELDPGRDRLHQLDPRHRRVFGAPVVADQDVGRRRRFRRPQQILWVGKDQGLEAGRQLGLDALRRIGGYVAEKQRFHAFTVWALRKSSRNVIPSPGRSGTAIMPSSTGKLSSTRSCRSGLAPKEYSTMNPAGEAAATCSPAAKAGAPAHKCGASFRLKALAMAEMRIASVMPPQIARSGCMMSTAPKTARSRKSCRVNSLSPAAIGMSVAARTAAQPALSSAVTGSSNQARLQSSTSRQKRFASATDRVPCASHISPISGPNASRAALTRAAEWRGSPSMMPTRILTAPNPPAAM